MGNLSEVQMRAFDDANWLDRLKTNKDGEYVNALLNVLEILKNDSEWEGVLAFNEFTGAPVKLECPPYDLAEEGEWTDDDTNMATAWLSARYGMMRPEPYIVPAMTTAAKYSTFHPIRDWLAGLEWDGKQRLATLFNRYFGAECSRYTELVAKKFLVAAVARVMEPGCKADNVLILEGGQGIRKSTGLQALAGEAYFSDQRLQLKGDKDSLQALSGKWIFELAELDSFNKAESTEAKAFFAAQSDRYRAPYGRSQREVKRQCVFAGTTNQDEYFRDQTGNRRYWPVFCTDVDLAALRRDRDQLWAEAAHLYREGMPHHVLEEERPLFEAEQAKREIADPWIELIATWLEAKNEVTLAQVLTDCLQIDRGRIDDRGMTTRVGRCMKRVGGWKKVEVCRPGVRFVYRRDASWVGGGNDGPL
ncbi:VapE domain-containing protein [Chromobacterium vaccinii]|uniref:VapE domain-containing protein n=1 Tax=Chromobacterium vaccinii TaxID=1108595 RepID=UPI003C78219D